MCKNVTRRVSRRIKVRSPIFRKKMTIAAPVRRKSIQILSKT